MEFVRDFSNLEHLAIEGTTSMNGQSEVSRTIGLPQELAQLLAPSLKSLKVGPSRRAPLHNDARWMNTVNILFNCYASSHSDRISALNCRLNHEFYYFTFSHCDLSRCSNLLSLTLHCDCGFRTQAPLWTGFDCVCDALSSIGTAELLKVKLVMIPSNYGTNDEALLSFFQGIVQILRGVRFASLWKLYFHLMDRLEAEKHVLPWMCEMFPSFAG
ncbi:hypothetical protein BD310DRAFT_978908 [Dichomitus squalens]|uniref:Uncharacterized protein n=1 Tax=Dichomitus squalens TaxID=114155 RepID=A0A4Q9PQ29_9APHY|nr:hypothetical protein BD310DRAFT_978908 [Dichomitus squalens]